MSDNISTDQFDNDIDFLVKEKQEKVKKMTEEQLLATLPTPAQEYFKKHPEMFPSFKAHAEGNHELSVKLSKEAVSENAPSLAAQLKHLHEAMSMGVKLAGVDNELIQKIEKTIKSIRSVTDLTPEEHAESDLLDKDGVDLHFTGGEFATLIRILDDAHGLYQKTLAHGKEMQERQPDDKMLKDAIEEGEMRHAIWHEFEELMFKQIENKYPLMSKKSAD
jgi:hypothetical protein